MLNFQFYQRVKVLYGNGSVQQIGELVSSIGYKKAFVVSDPGIISTGLVDRVTESLKASGCGYEVFDGVRLDPPDYVVEDGAKRCLDAGCDCVVGVGGGACIDTAKAVNLLRFNDGPILRFADFSTPMNTSPGLIVIPTTSGTGSEVSDGIVLSDRDHNKHPILATGAMSDYAILDPEVMLSMPPKLTIATGMDAFSHCAESMVTNVANGLVDFFVEQGVRTCVEYLPRAARDGKDLEARGKMAVAAMVGGWMLGYGHTHAGHSFGHVIGGLFNVPHGIAVMAAEPYVIEFNAPAVPERTRRLGELLGVAFAGGETPEEIGAMVRDAMIDFRDCKVGMPSIKSYSYDEARFEEMAVLVENEPFQAFNPRKMTAADALAIFKRIYA